MDKAPSTPISPASPISSAAAVRMSSPSPSPSSSSSTGGLAPPVDRRGRARSSSIADMLSTPPPVKLDAAGNAPALEDWTTVPLSALVQNDQLLTITGDLPVEQAFDRMISHQYTSLPVVQSAATSGGEPISSTRAECFDYADISSLLLLVTGHLKPARGATALPPNLDEYVEKARAGFDVPVSFVMQLQPREPYVTLHESDTVLTAVEQFGRGLHRLLVTNDAGTQLLGLLSQRRLLRYLWDNARRFPSLEPLLQNTILDLGIGEPAVIAISGDRLVIDALEKMHNESVTSLAVVDSEGSLLGNISIVDVKHLTKSSAAHLLHATCLQFLTIILSDRGIENGKDSFPIFHVTPMSTLSHTIAKLVATKSHRMWIVQGKFPATSFGSPISTPTTAHHHPHPQRSQSPAPNASPALVPVSSPTTRGLGMKLIGVVSLTDILSLLARSAGVGDVDPTEARRQRRRSSSSSVRSFTLDASAAPAMAGTAATARRSVSIERNVAYAAVKGGPLDSSSRR
ncbi:uncharacterized protein V1518DRAFT_412674 [Limtongia smithiae]|uniref:uncharacterized protein n=1 Tax=Limtongia smithiae TaxID=1125753 RepID=UPI0034CE41A5